LPCFKALESPINSIQSLTNSIKSLINCREALFKSYLESIHAHFQSVHSSVDRIKARKNTFLEISRTISLGCFTFAHVCRPFFQIGEVSESQGLS
jgi:two-component sensor histidine kinase